jgi:diguanylate cyclase (GGDEF)-like protein
MGTRADNVIEARTIPQKKKAGVESLARIPNPPDTLPLSAVLQTTLDLDELLSLFKQEVERHLNVDGLTFRHSGHGIVSQQGHGGQHCANYGLSLMDETLGEVTMSRSRPFAEQDLAIFEHLLCPLLYPLRNALRYHVALSAAYRDPLTGLDNRAALDETLPRETEMTRRHNLPLSMLMVDLDHFKLVNDKYGHAVGDCVLRTAAQRMKAALRTSDRLFRFGGEEFVMLLPATDLHGARVVAERIRLSLQGEGCVCDGESVHFTASIGVSELGKGDNHHTLFNQADKALYRAKAEGRNRVTCY